MLRLYLLIVLVVGALVFFAYRIKAKETTTGSVSDAAGKPVAEAIIEVIVVDGREGRIPEKGTFVTLTDSNGRFQIVLVNGSGQQFRVLAEKQGYKPEWTILQKHPQESLKFVLQEDFPLEQQQYLVGDKVIAREEEWCNAEIVKVGTTSTRASDGNQDMSGRVEVKWDDWDTTQWLRTSEVRRRPPEPVTSPIRCPAISKQAVSESVKQSVDELLSHR